LSTKNPIQTDLELNLGGWGVVSPFVGLMPENIQYDIIFKSEEIHSKLIQLERMNRKLQF
jgi:hypothetical protein